MAIREARINFDGLKKQESSSIHTELWAPFTFYMDAVMRGRFKEYSGPEVKGINIVNLHLWNADDTKQAFPPHWVDVGNVHQKVIAFDFRGLAGTPAEKLKTLIDLFIREAADSPKPQMQRLVRHIEESQARIPLDGVFERAAEYRKALHAEVATYECAPPDEH